MKTKALERPEPKTLGALALVVLGLALATGLVGQLLWNMFWPSFGAGLVAFAVIAIRLIDESQTGLPEPTTTTQAQEKGPTNAVDSNALIGTHEVYEPRINDTQPIPLSVEPTANQPTQKAQSETLTPPPIYRHRLHKLSLVLPLLGYAGVLIAGLGVIYLLVRIDWLSGVYGTLLALAYIAAVGLPVAQTLWKWLNRPIVCDPSDGRLSIVQAGNLWLFLRPSSPDIYPLGEGDIDIFTPKQSIIEAYICKKSQTLILRNSKGRDGEDVKLRMPYVYNVDHILAIDKYRRQLQTASVGYQQDMLSVLLRIERKLGDNEDARQLLEDIKRRTSSPGKE